MTNVTQHEIRAVTVVLVDDEPDIRFLLRLAFARDDRFKVVGEGATGAEAIELASQARPDLLVLDRNMPVLGGVEALPDIRAVSPRTAVVLYTAGADRQAAQAAFAAGALEVLDKMAPGANMIETVAAVLADHWADPEAEIHVAIGPVSADAARVWIANTSKIMAAVRAHPERVAEPPSADVLDRIEFLLDSWASLLAQDGEFRWAARARPDDVRRLVEQWAALDRMTDAELDALGVRWSPPEGGPFFEALTAGVLEALNAHDETRKLGGLLAGQWGVANEVA